MATKRNMKMTKTLALATLVAGSLFAGSNLSAQNSTNPPPARAGRARAATLDQITTQLALTDEQKPKVKAVLDEQTQKQADLRADTSVAQADRRKKMTEISDAATAKLKAILTAEQFTKYQALTPAPRARTGAGAAPPAAAPKTN